MPTWLLRVLAFAVSLGSVAGSTDYVLTHPKNPAAPLQPALVDPAESEEPEPTPPPRTARPATPTPTARPTVAPTASARIATPTGTVLAVVTLPPSTEVPTARPTPAATSRATPVPSIQIAPGVRATSLPRVTTTHRS